jgi:hypothetical protein
MVYLETFLRFDTFVRRSTNKIHVLKNHIKIKKISLHQEIRNGRKKLNKIENKRSAFHNLEGTMIWEQGSSMT